MGFALDLQSFAATAPGGGGAAMAAFPGGLDSLTLRNARAGTDILTLAAWTKAQAAGSTTVIAPSQHDMVRNFRAVNAVNQVDNKIPRQLPLHWKPQDPLTITQVGSATAGDVELFHMLNWYEDAPGVEANLINSAELRKRAVNLLTVQNTTTATAGGQYSGSQTIVAAADLLKADTEYAIIGGAVLTVCGALCIQGVDFGNLRVGFPGLAGDTNWTKDFFANLADWHQVPCIPVFSSANRASVFVTNAQDENLGAVAYSLNLVQLAPRPAAGADGKPLSSAQS